MQVKTVLLTGANSGMGLATATALTGMGARILLVRRDAKVAVRLWRISSQLVGLPADILPAASPFSRSAV